MAVLAKGRAAKRRKPKLQIQMKFSLIPSPTMKSPRRNSERQSIRWKCLLIANIPRTKPPISMPLLEMVMTQPAVLASAKASTKGESRIWTVPRKKEKPVPARTKIQMPFFP